MQAQMSRIHRCGCSGRTGEPELVEKPLGEYAHSATLPPSARVDQIMADIFDILGAPGKRRDNPTDLKLFFG
jgi:hypothetical protein